MSKVAILVLILVALGTMAMVSGLILLVAFLKSNRKETDLEHFKRESKR